MSTHLAMNIDNKSQDRRSTPLLQIMLARQDQNEQNYLSEADIRTIADETGYSTCRIYSTASFYHEIKLVPRGRFIIQVCTNAPCENAGKQEILKALTVQLGIELDETTSDKMFTLEQVNCLGACYMSPAIKIKDKVYGNLRPQDIPQILSDLRKEAYDHD